MQRGSDTHGPRQDEAMQREVSDVLRSGHSSRAEEWREAEPSGEDEPEVDRAPGGTLAGGVPDGMTEGDVTGRAELAAVLARAYPADRERLLAVAQENNALDRILDTLRRLPADTQFNNVNEVWTTLGYGVEEQRF